MKTQRVLRVFFKTHYTGFRRVLFVRSRGITCDCKKV